MKPGLLRASAETLALSAVAAGETFHLGSACMPSFFTAKSWVVDGTPSETDKRIRDWRSGYRPAVFIGLGLSVALSLLARSPWPTIFSAGAAIAMVDMYEHALPPEHRLSLDQWPGFFLTGEYQLPSLAALPSSCCGAPALPAGSSGL